MSKTFCELKVGDSLYAIRLVGSYTHSISAEIKEIKSIEERLNNDIYIMLEDYGIYVSKFNSNTYFMCDNDINYVYTDIDSAKAELRTLVNNTIRRLLDVEFKL